MDADIERIGDIEESLNRLRDLATFGGVFSMLMVFFYLDHGHAWIPWCIYTFVLFVLFVICNNKGVEYRDLYDRLCEERYNGTCRI